MAFPNSLLVFLILGIASFQIPPANGSFISNAFSKIGSTISNAASSVGSFIGNTWSSATYGIQSIFINRDPNLIEFSLCPAPR